MPKQPVVQMRHPDLDPEGRFDPARASSRAFEKLYAPKGWRLVTDDGTLVPTREEIADLNGEQLSGLLGEDAPRKVEDRRAAVLERFYPGEVEDDPLEPAASDATATPGS